ncbi:filamentous hemagglutinin [Trinickia dabaoshanensis]|uniref:Filamentous hemagglutinin n=1 Tax=Trinickia dabaoshanensis TaxID=564714 RepID=A0A2N7VGE9_9BURK|nr:filamentous hemagglutinin N-terminal domain-containing protein [Trinickia dabaoshanensis]PMS16214.1 filamentous hemagglutinin [Trinickia dabaoshanensis]
MKSSNSASHKARSVSAISFAVVALLASVHVHAGGLLPAGGHFVAGTGSIEYNGKRLSINQTSSRGIIDWKGFSIGRNNRVDIDNGNGATLNRVTGDYLSWISGTLTSTGSVYLINPQGVIVAPSGVISTGGRFVVSTLDVGNNSFMNGGLLTFTGNSNAQVVNLGTIGSSGGDVFMIARREVSNSGSIAAPAGSIELVVGQNVLLQDSTTSRQVFVETGSHGTVLNRGALQAAQISLQGADGNIYALCGNHSVIRATGTAARDGHIWLVADTGYVKQVGRGDATNADGTGGTVDTIAATFAPSLLGGTTVRAGIWNIKTPSLTVTWPISAALSNSLNAGTSVDVDTTSGSIEVGANLSWKGNASLMLGAYGSITVDRGKTIGNQGAGNLTLRADATGIDNHGGVTNNGTLDWSNSTGIVNALYDMNGTYAPGTQLANAVWMPSPVSAPTQITGYELVNSISDLQNVSQDLNGKYALGENLDGAGADVTSMGNATTPFAGEFNGMGHSIDDITIMPVYSTDASLQSFGLFGAIGIAGVVHNLNLTNSRSSLSGDANHPPPFAGLLAGVNQGHIANVFASGSLTSDALRFLGGLVGLNEGLIERSATDVTVESDFGLAAGLVAENTGTISQTYSTGPVTGSHSIASGLAFFNTGTISQSFVTGQVPADIFIDPNPGAITGDTTAIVAPDSYWNVQTTGLTNGGGAPASNGLTTAQMSHPDSFVGWDFSATGAWAMPAGWTHPVLRWQLADGLPPQ